jgi:hypothetical protein
MTQPSAPQRSQTFTLDKFDGLTTGTADGTSPGQMRRLEGWQFDREVGSLSLAPTRRSLFANESAVKRMLPLWEASATPAVYCQAADGSITYRATWTTAAGTVITLGANPSKLTSVMRGKAGLVTSGGTANGATYATGYWHVDPATASAFEVTALTPTGPVSNKFSDSAWAATLAFVAVDTPAGNLDGKSIGISVVAARKVAVGDDFFWLPLNTLNARIHVVATPIIAPNDTGRLTWTSNTVDGMYPLLTDVNTVGIVYDLGVASSDSGAATTTLDIPDFPATAIPVNQIGSTILPGYLSARVAGEVRVSRQGRTWVAVNAVRDMSYEPNFTGQTATPPPSGTTLYFSEVGNLQYPVDNFLSANVSGDVTALANLGDSLVVFSKRDACVVTGNSPSDFYVRRLDAVRPGALEQESVQEWRGVVLFRGFDGVYQLAGDGQVKRISDALRDVFLNAGESAAVASAIDQKNGVYYISINGVAYGCELDGLRWFKLPWTADSMAGGPVVLFASGTQVYALDDATTTVTGVLETDDLDLGSPEVDKFFRRLRLSFDNGTGTAGSVSVTPISHDGTVLPSLPARAIPTGNTTAIFQLPGYHFTGRAARFRISVTGKPGLTLRPRLEIDYGIRPRRNR